MAWAAGESSKRAVAKRALTIGREAALLAARAGVHVLRALLSLLLALVLLFEEWGWRPLAELMGLIARARPIARTELWIAALAPYPALVVFALPTVLLAPVKIAALWLLANGHPLSAGALLVGAKITGTALVARLFMLTRPALMRISWFASLYNSFVPWKEALFARVRASWAWRWGRIARHRLRNHMVAAWARTRPVLAAARERAVMRVRLALTLARARSRQFWRRVR